MMFSQFLPNATRWHICTKVSNRTLQWQSSWQYTGVVQNSRFWVTKAAEI